MEFFLCARRIIGTSDRFRGVYGTRMVLFMNKADMERLGVAEGASVTLATATDDGIRRELPGLRATAYDMPPGCYAGYYPECNVLVPLWQHAEGSKVPAAKFVPVRVVMPDAAAGGA